MINTKRNKIFGFVGVLIIILALIILSYRPVIFQEGNPIPLMKGIIRLNFTQDKIVKLNMDGDKYLTKSKNGQEIIKVHMQDRGYAFREQMGAGYFFQSTTEKSAVVIHKQYSRFYSLWNITENINSLDNLEDDNNLWETTTNDDDITFQYPKEILAEYISEAQWPPKLKIENEVFACNPSGNEIQLGGQTELRLVDNRSYCVTKESEGAAGSIYTTYTYVFPKNNQIGVITFTLRFVQCQNYDESKALECENERAAFDVDGMVDRIAQSIKIKSEQLSIAEQLQDCLPKSDMGSYEKCNELLETIRNFDDCVRAGFSIMKSNPPQCITVDDRTFIDETNSTWEAALAILNNCEVKSVFQTHSKLVTLKLKNGNKVIVYEPQIDDVMDVVDGLKGRCGDIIMATE